MQLITPNLSPDKDTVIVHAYLVANMFYMYKTKSNKFQDIFYAIADINLSSICT